MDYRRGSREPCGLKLDYVTVIQKNLTSRLARALWIEISGNVLQKEPRKVEARESLVDLNFTGGIYFFIDLVNKSGRGFY